MSELAQVAGIGARVQWMGKECEVKTRTLGHYASMEAEIVAARGNPLESLASIASTLKEQPDLMRAMVEAATKQLRNWRMVTFEDLREFELTPRGEAFGIHAAVAHNFETLSIGDVHHHILEETAKHGVDALVERNALWAAIAQANGEDWVGNLTSLQETSPETDTPSTGESSVGN